MLDTKQKLGTIAGHNGWIPQLDTKQLDTKQLGTIAGYNGWIQSLDIKYLDTKQLDTVLQQNTLADTLLFYYAYAFLPFPFVLM